MRSGSESQSRQGWRAKPSSRRITPCALGRLVLLTVLVTTGPTTAPTAAKIRHRRAVHEIADLVLPRTDMNEWWIEVLRDRHDHPWIGERRGEDAWGTSIGHARSTCPTSRAITTRSRTTSCGGRWLLLAPRKHDVFASCRGPTLCASCDDLTHLTHARLARCLRDRAVRIYEVDLEGVNAWGFDELRRVDAAASRRPNHSAIAEIAECAGVTHTSLDLDVSH